MRLLAIAVVALTFVRPAYAQLAPPNALGVTYGHVHLNVSDAELHKKLWVEHFGGVITQKGTLVAVKLPGMLIAFRNAKPTGGSEGTVMDHIGFKVRNLKEVLDKWRAAGYQVQSEFKALKVSRTPTSSSRTTSGSSCKKTPVFQPRPPRTTSTSSSRITSSCGSGTSRTSG